MVVTIFGDVIIPHGGEVALVSLIEAASLVGISELAIRSAVNRLADDGWLVSEAHGRCSIFSISEQGFLRSIVPMRRVYQCPDVQWTGQWNILIAKEWDLERDVYAQASHDLQWAGYGRVCDNVFIRPQIDGDNMLCCAGSLLEKKVVCFMGSVKQCPINGRIEEVINRVWDISTVAARYMAFNDCYSPLLEELSKSPSMRSAQAFALRLFMMHDFRRIRIIDPLLPLSLLPRDWDGIKAFDLARKIYQALLPLSEHYITEFMNVRDGSMPAAQKSFYERFGGLSPT
ncbi:PaaX family transcriptional regulator [Sulfuricystis multivorans]|uniref:PaaX family transcriptional regulator n=1 Tax=Sulfuricystis multivorans TaxID=2211108 RepID=UPI0015597B74|nr:PaaX family transcriptional regulator C-terminal domain-containing protein [Sulfuricystis multivorans]